MKPVHDGTLKKVKRRDRAARWVITLGGVTIIASVIAILVLIVSVTLPLFLPERAEEVARAPLPGELRSGDVVAVGIELSAGDQAMGAHLLSRDGTFLFFDPRSQAVLARERISPPGKAGGRTVQAVERHAGSRYTLLWSDGAVSMVETSANASLSAGGDRSVAYAAQVLEGIESEGGPMPEIALARKKLGPESVAGTRPEIVTFARLFAGNRFSITRQTATENLLGEKVLKAQEEVIETPALGRITAATMDRDGQVLYAGTATGQLVCWRLDDDGAVQSREILTAFKDGRAVTSLAMVLGDVSLAVGDAEGGLTVWFPVRPDQKSCPLLTRIHDLPPHSAAVQEILASTGDKSLLALSSDGEAYLDHVTSERKLLSLGDPGRPLVRIGQAPQGDAAIGLAADGDLIAWKIHAPHPEVSWTTLFGRTHYEGYDQPAFTWQTTGSEDSEPKFSLVPLLFGTLKGTFYAMLLAGPLALFAAAYTSHFTTPAFKRAIKPVVEIMAAVPSVVIGFLVALWLAPILERWILAVFACLVTIPLVFAAFMVFWWGVRRFDCARRVEGGYEFLVLLPVLAAGVGLAVLLVGPLEQWLFDGNCRLWLNQAAGMRYDQRNSIIIAFGLGFAVIPIVFSIAEDSLSSVPHSLTAASMALGGSRWQTLWRVVLPSASPGIFAGVMIGFGRAVGETMIVLMATGNTPILDWSPFNGMRTLSANIAVEIPEAPVGGTLYRLLFLCAVLLFLLTFALNTAADLVRQRLRKRYGRL